MIPKNSVLSKMSCLVVARKAWKSFTTKLQRKLRKIQFKKPRNNGRSTKLKLPHHQSSSFTLRKSTQKSLHSRRIKHHKLFTGVLRQRKLYSFKKQPQYTPPPIFIDDLFKFRAAELANSQESTKRINEASNDDPCTSCSNSMARKANSSRKGKDGLRISDQGLQHAARETVLDRRIYPSHQMRISSAPDEGPLIPAGIDVRAEEFITRFRAELQFQETIARYL